MGEISTLLAEILAQLLTQITDFAPRLLSALLLLLVGFGVGWLIAALLRRVLKQLAFENLMERTGLADALSAAGFGVDASTILSRLIFWLLFLGFLLSAIDALGLQAAAAAMRSLVAFSPNLIGSVLIVIGGALLARFTGQTVQAIAARAGLEMAGGLGQAVRYFLLALTFVLAVGQLGLKVDFLGDALINLVIVLVAVLGLALALGGRDIVTNLLAGFYVREIYTLGDTIQIGDHSGNLEAIDTLKATIRTEEGNISVPNSLLINEVTVAQK
jgi:small-conductance mechanosensitive channel